MSLKIATIGGDGIGPEVVNEGLKVLDAASKQTNLQYDITAFPYSGGHYLQTGEVITPEQIEELRQFDAVFLGAVGHPDVAPGIIEKGLLLELRFKLDLYINLRPVRLLDGVKTPLAGRSAADIQFDCIRENTEDLYTGAGGVTRINTPQEVATQEMLATRFGVERCLHYAFKLAQAKQEDNTGNGILTLIHKTNVLTHCGGTWFRAFNEIGEAHYPDINREYHHVDACCMYMVANPQDYDTLVVPNMFGDIITDLGAAIAGGMGMAASGNINPDGDAPSVFEPVHGSAPDIAGQNKANPLAAVLSLAMLLRETGRIQSNDAAGQTADLIDNAIRKVVKDLEGQPMDRLFLSTTEVGDALAAAL